MQKDIFQNIPDFDYLIENKSFEDLSNNEKEIVLQYISPDEYEQYRSDLIMLKKGMKKKINIVMRNDIKQSLLNVYDDKYKHNYYNSFVNAVNFKIPLYQTGIAASIIIALLLFFTKPIEKVKYVKITDTLYIEKPVYTELIKKEDKMITENQHKINFKNKTQKKNKPTPRPNYYKEYMTLNILSKMQGVQKSKRGQSIDKDSMLMAWITPVL